MDNFNLVRSIPELQCVGILFQEIVFGIFVAIVSLDTQIDIDGLLGVVQLEVLVGRNVLPPSLCHVGQELESLHLFVDVYFEKVWLLLYFYQFDGNCHLIFERSELGVVKDRVAVRQVTK